MFSRLVKNDSARAGALFLLILIILFSAVFFKGFVFGGGDTTAAKGMTQQLNAYHAETGEYPLWQPYIFSGMPAFSSMMFTKWVYFPNFVLGILNSAGIPTLWTMLFHYLLAAMGVYTLLRYLKVDFLTALLGGIAFMLTPFFIVMITVGHGSQMMTAAYLPWLIYAAKRIFDNPDLKGLLILAIIAGLQFQRGHVQIAYYGWMAVGWYGLLEAVFRFRSKDWKKFPLSLAYLLSGLVLGIGLAAVLYIPSLAYAAHSIRGGSAGGGLDYGYATSWSLPPYEVLSLMFSDWFGFGGQNYWGGRPFTEHSDFLGMTVIILMVAAFFNRDLFKEKIFLLSTIVLALLISFGNYFPYLYDLLFNLLPFFNKFRVPSMIMILLELMAAILAGLGLYTLLNLNESRKKGLERKLLIAAGILGAVFVLVLLFKGLVNSAFSASLANSPKYHPQLNSPRIEMFFSSLVTGLFIGTLGLLLIWAYLAEKIKGLVLSLGMLALVTMELGHIDLRFTKNAINPTRMRAAEQESAAIRKLRELTAENPGRIFPVHTLFGSNIWAMYGLESIGGYSPAKLKVLQDFLNSTEIEQTFLPKYYSQTASGASPKLIEDVDVPLRKRHLDVLRNLNVKYLVSPYPINDPLFILVDQPTHIIGGKRVQVLIYKFMDDYPRAWFVSNIQTAETSAQISEYMDESTREPRELAFVKDPGATLSQAEFSIGKAVVIERSLQHLILGTENAGSGFLVLSEVFYPAGWSAYLDGDTKLEMYATNELIRGFQIPAGNHKIELIYEPSAVKAGFRLTLLSILILSGLGGLYFYNSRKSTKKNNAGI
ncbi:MAG: hypothetical protein HQ508_02800 [Candidatus Marinimicrobia bacterium]|nr:hypothetical protein [Candidatus Neomarinimicrobiota bacterium]